MWKSLQLFKLIVILVSSCVVDNSDLAADHGVVSNSIVLLQRAIHSQSNGALFKHASIGAVQNTANLTTSKAAETVVNKAETGRRKWRKRKKRRQVTRDMVYVIKTFPGNYETRLKLQFETWLTLVRPENIVVLTYTPKGDQHRPLPSFLDTRVTVLSPECPDDGKAGTDGCCREKFALQWLKHQNFKRAFFIDDDTFVRVPRWEKFVSHQFLKSGEILATECTQDRTNITGFCGGCGYMFRKGQIQKLVNQKFEAEYDELCKEVRVADVATGALAKRRGLTINSGPDWALNGNALDSSQINAILADEKTPLLLQHAVRSPAAMWMLHGGLNLESEMYRTHKR
eukprot:gnl/MRDRNA2_/MRDRNA2_99818_c0_seq1.p1 gnl/MRDRNA2_/MRDRNA2_99818_c0~~gnl/MRDRNA2_/MRDRNA2_99818_c0_seq1.p1  ORF type:complete len:343 (+),score=46.73 gnl/MRDRNA2_/MRDRNA2_99818_c0_seq1:99-1127(+)